MCLDFSERATELAMVATTACVFVSADIPVTKEPNVLSSADNMMSDGWNRFYDGKRVKPFTIVETQNTGTRCDLSFDAFLCFELHNSTCIGGMLIGSF